jgi:HD-GYP domain-containing protein (c-di-GMP phosphodiesterase class II)
LLRVDLHRAKPGMRLALPVQNPKAPSKVLLKVGYELTEGTIDRLKEHRLRWVWVRYPSLGFLEKFVSSETVQNQAQVVGHITSTFETLQQGASAKLPYETYTASIGKLIEHLVTTPSAAMFLGDIDAADDGLMRHSSAVTYLSLLLGLKLEAYMVRERKHVDPARAKEVRNLGLGAMLHDVGVMQLPPGVRERFRDTGDDSDPAWREHPATGFKMLRGRVDASAAAVVLHHHQRFDGSGYAGREFPAVDGHNIHIFARIAAVADQFDLIRNPANLPQQPTVWALSAMINDPMRSRFDPTVLAALLTVVPPYPPGSIVRLSDGRWAVAIDHNPEQPCRPVVQIIPSPDALDEGDAEPGETIDLSDATARLSVVEADGRDVREVNFAVPEDLAAMNTLASAWG